MNHLPRAIGIGLLFETILAILLVVLPLPPTVDRLTGRPVAYLHYPALWVFHRVIGAPEPVALALAVVFNALLFVLGAWLVLHRLGRRAE